ncbi:Transposable element P transposase [Frankliniella fusca]|uniref:Transposable element P transposase n=1 Tax=Frankliniella fusca TaxID=407009 RepID=A0AAE1HH11_9NEOP|nr:Transposable element P transposase [Frankliniella fusca]KAK3921029.1 Transposable element P transposase [Frankliniella fusca]KAK3931432.1 Transposable element P transposase [Frankliniella fusca]
MNEDEKDPTRRRRRGKGQKRLVGRRPKKGRPTSSQGDEDVTSESQGSSNVSVSESGGTTLEPTTDSESSIAASDVGHACKKSINEPHLCSETEGFSETTTSELTVNETDFEEQRESRKRRKRVPQLAYRRKYASKKVAAESDSEEEECEINITRSFDSEDLSITEPSDSSSSDEANLNETLEENVTHSDSGEGRQTGAMNANNSQGPATESLGSTTFINTLLNNMKLLLPSEWMADTSDDTLRLFTINKSSNPSVERSVVFSTEEKAFRVFIHGAPVPSENKIFQDSSRVDLDNIGDLSDFLCRLVTRVRTAVACTGINSHRDFWNLNVGFVDYSPSFHSPKFRSASCLILIDGKKTEQCADCRHLLRKLERDQKRSEREKEDPCSTRDRDLSKAGLKVKKDKYKKMARHEKQRADRLQKRVESLKIKLDEALKDELTALLRANQDKMSEVQKTFWLTQMKAMNLEDKRGLRWDPMLIRLALHLHSLSPNAYEFLGNSKILSLPSKRRLFDYSHFVETKEGCQKELLLMIADKAAKCGEEEHYKYINVMFDEMHIKSGLVTHRSTGELVGFTKLSGIDEEIAKITQELNMKTYRPRLAKKVLVYLARGITSNVKDVVAVFTTDDLAAHQLYDRTWDVIYNLEEVGLKVLTLSCDGASVNRKFIMMHDSLDKSSPYTYCSSNLASEDNRPLYFIVDPPHLIKTIRNALANSFSHRKSRKLWKNGEYLSWKVIEEVYEITKNWKNTGHKMKKAHVKLSSFSVMTVLFATQAMSNSTAKCIEDLSAHPSMEKYDTKELVSFIRLINRFFDCVNSRTEQSEEDVMNVDKEPYSDPNDSRLSFLENDVLNYFEDWKREVTDRPGIYSDTERSRMIISHQALGALHITIKSITSAIRFMLTAGAPFVGARVFNQDPAEQYFSKLRRMQGDGNNPLVKDVLDSRLSLVAQGHVAVSSLKGNVQGEKRKEEIEIDSSPLPSRKVPRKSKD